MVLASLALLYGPLEAELRVMRITNIAQLTARVSPSCNTEAQQ